MTENPQSSPGFEAENVAERAAEKAVERAVENSLKQTDSKPPWIELPLAWIRYLRTELSIQECIGDENGKCEREKLLTGARGHLRIAEMACMEKHGWLNRFRKANRLERIWANIRAADVNLLAQSSDEELTARCGFVKAMVQQYIHKDSPQRIGAEATIKSILNGAQKEESVSKRDRIVIVQALGISYAALDGRLRRVRIFANMLWLATGLTFLGAAALAIWGAFDPQTLSLCFEHPQKGDLITGNGNPPLEPEDVIVCPTGEEIISKNRRFVDDYADRLDVLSVELAGLVGAALTTIAALRRISDNHTSPYALPLAAATLKFPLGAIAAFVGILFIRGAFLPGLSALDTPIQILAWSVVFGAAQQLVTHFIDQKAQTTLSGIGKPPDPPVKTAKSRG
ncbi:hypothetical protein ABZ464_29440 [Streptomyces sp. NPDC005820]|uniref:hypothetical protein n=1 Tax=Streptomyces sp. NPDC005820 TaxID=3157069 RepID=UPI0033E00AB0